MLLCAFVGIAAEKLDEDIHQQSNVMIFKKLSEKQFTNMTDDRYFETF